MNINTEIIILISIFTITIAFYQNQFDETQNTVVTPKTNDELTNALCSKAKGKLCLDDDPKTIILDSVFDFTGTEGTTTEKGCWHRSSDVCYLKGQKQLNVNNQCDGLEPVNVTYDNAGRNPLIVGSNKHVLGSGIAGLRGKGFLLYSVHDVIIQNVSITDINCEVIWAGDAIDMRNVTNVLIDGNYIQNIGRQMIVTHFGPCQNIMISNNEFNGSTPHSATCNGRHYWMFLFLGKNDTIFMWGNSIYHASGRLPHITGLRGSAVLLHMLENSFYDISYSGGIEALNISARILLEGNTFTNVPRIVRKNKGLLYFTLTQAQCDACVPYIDRPCEANVLINSSIKTVDADLRVLVDLKPYASILPKPRNYTEPNNSEKAK